MNSSIKLGQGLAWGAWIVFIASLSMPMESNSLAGPCAWPCGQPFTDYGWQNAVFFVMSMLAFGLNFIQAIYIAIFDPQTIAKILDSLLITGIHAIIGLGQVLIVLAPLLTAKLKNPAWQRLHLGFAFVSALSAIAYGFVPGLRLGLDLLSGYYLWALSFILTLTASILMYEWKSKDFSAGEGWLNYQQP